MRTLQFERNIFNGYSANLKGNVLSGTIVGCQQFLKHLKDLNKQYTLLQNGVLQFDSKDIKDIEPLIQYYKLGIKNVANDILEKYSSFDIELEMRFFDMIKSEQEFLNMIFLLSKQKTPIISKSTVTSYGDVRKIEENGNIIYQRKHKNLFSNSQNKYNVLFSIINSFERDIKGKNFIKTINCKFERNYEQKLTEQEFNSAKIGTSYIRERERYSFDFDTFIIDLTRIKSPKISWECEIEYKTINNSPLKDNEIIAPVKQSLLVLFPNQYNIIDIVWYRTQFAKVSKAIYQSEIKLPDNITFDVSTNKCYRIKDIVKPINLQRPEFSPNHHFNKNLDKYAVTNKLDGTNYSLAIFLFTDKLTNNLYCLVQLFNDKDSIIIYKDNAVNTKQIDPSILNKLKSFGNVILCQTEVVIKDNDLNIYLYDTYENDKIDSLNDRLSKLEIIRQFVNLTQVHSITEPGLIQNNAKVYIKSFFFYRETLEDNIKDCIEYMSRQFGMFDIDKHNDGIILEPLNRSDNLNTLKWKFPEKVSIDLKLTKLNTSSFETVYNLTYGKDIIFKINNKVYNFSINSNANCDGILCGNLDGLIGEFIYKDNRLELLRLRLDKIYANGKLTVETTFTADMMNKFLLTDVISLYNKFKNTKTQISQPVQPQVQPQRILPAPQVQRILPMPQPQRPLPVQQPQRPLPVQQPQVQQPQVQQPQRILPQPQVLEQNLDKDLEESIIPNQNYINDKLIDRIYKNGIDKKFIIDIPKYKILLFNMDADYIKNFDGIITFITTDQKQYDKALPYLQDNVKARKTFINYIVDTSVLYSYISDTESDILILPRNYDILSQFLYSKLDIIIIANDTKPSALDRKKMISSLKITRFDLMNNNYIIYQNKLDYFTSQELLLKKSIGNLRTIEQDISNKTDLLKYNEDQQKLLTVMDDYPGRFIMENNFNGNVIYDYLSLIPSNENIKREKFAYVWLLMKGDSYLPGIFTSVWSVKRTNPKANTVVMVTPDVSKEAREIISLVADYITEVAYIYHKSKPLRTERQQEIYNTWIESSYTKWQCLRLNFDKILFLDADTAILDNIDHLFNMQTPAGHVSFYNQKSALKKNGLNNWYLEGNTLGKDGYPIHNSNLTQSQIKKSLEQNGTIPSATSILLSPTLEDYNNYRKMLNENEVFGTDTVINGVDEQSIAYYYSLWNKGPQTVWKNIHQRYNPAGFWTENFIYENDFPIVLHWYSDEKPWILDAKNPKNKDGKHLKDIIVWYDIFIDGIIHNNVNINKMNLKISYSLDEYKEILINSSQKFISDWYMKWNNITNFNTEKTISNCLDLLDKISKHTTEYNTGYVKTKEKLKYEIFQNNSSIGKYFADELILKEYIYDIMTLTNNKVIFSFLDAYELFKLLKFNTQLKSQNFNIKLNEPFSISNTFGQKLTADVLYRKTIEDDNLIFFDYIISELEKYDMFPYSIIPFNKNIKSIECIYYKNSINKESFRYKTINDFINLHEAKKSSIKSALYAQALLYNTYDSVLSPTINKEILAYFNLQNVGYDMKNTIDVLNETIFPEDNQLVIINDTISFKSYDLQEINFNKEKIYNDTSYELLSNNFCIKMRETYLKTMKFSIDYYFLGYEKNDPITECFTNQTCNYFNIYTTEFEDLDNSSIGNFFSIRTFPTKLIYIFMLNTFVVGKIIDHITKYNLDKSYNFVIITNKDYTTKYNNSTFEFKCTDNEFRTFKQICIGNLDSKSTYQILYEPKITHDDNVLLSLYKQSTFTKGDLFSKLSNGTNLYRINTIGQGNCFYHALLISLLGYNYNESELFTFKDMLSKNFNVDHYLALPTIIQTSFYTCAVQKANNTLWNKYFESSQNKSSLWDKIVSQFPDLNLLQIIDKLNIPKDDATILLKILNEIISETKNKLLEHGFWIQTYMKYYISNLLKINIVEYSSINSKFEITSGIIIPHYKTIIIYNTGNHYEGVKIKGRHGAYLNIDELFDLSL